MDAHANFAISTVATAPSPADTGTSLVVASGEGARFPAVPFNASVWPAGEAPDPTNAEIVRVTAISTDTLTIVRGQEGTSARSIVAGDVFAATITAKTLTDIEGVAADGWIPAGETWTYGSADDPTYTFTVSGDKTGKYSPGMKIRLSQTTGGTKYGFVTKVAHASGTTTVTVYMGTDYDLANEAIAAPCFSTVKAPVGFPLDPSKWTVTFTDSSRRNAAALTPTTWFNPGSLSFNLPIGVWDLQWWAMGYVADGSSVGMSVKMTLSTANNSESDTDLTSYGYHASATELSHIASRRKTIALTAKTTYYINVWGVWTGGTPSALAYLNDFNPMRVNAVCAYL